MVKKKEPNIISRFPQFSGRQELFMVQNLIYLTCNIMAYSKKEGMLFWV